MRSIPTTKELEQLLGQMSHRPGAMHFAIPVHPVLIEPRANVPWWREWMDWYDSDVILVDRVQLPTQALATPTINLPCVSPIGPANFSQIRL